MEVAIGDAYILCAEKSDDESGRPGIIIYIKDKEGNIIQDISGAFVDENSIRHILYKDCYDEDYTDENNIPIYELAIVDDVLLNATDYIGNKPDDFGATRYDLEKMRTSDSFKKFLSEKIREDEFDDMTQIGCADYVWEYYQEWDS